MVQSDSLASLTIAPGNEGDFEESPVRRFPG